MIDEENGVAAKAFASLRSSVIFFAPIAAASATYVQS
jgi:hypothetical protein